MDKLERVARAICTARGANPDGETGRGEWVTTEEHHGGSTSYTREQVPHPGWKLHEAEAKAFLAAYEAAEPGLASKVASIDTTAEREIANLRRDLEALKEQVKAAAALARQASSR